MLKHHNAVTPVRLKPAALRSRVKHSTTEPLCPPPPPPKKRCFLFYLFCPHSNQSPSIQGGLIYFSLILTKALPQRVFSSIFALNLTKALPKMAFFSIFALILTKALPKRVFSLFCPYSSQIPTKKVFFLYFCPYFNQSPATKGVSSGTAK